MTVLSVSNRAATTEGRRQRGTCSSPVGVGWGVRERVVGSSGRAISRAAAPSTAAGRRRRPTAITANRATRASRIGNAITGSPLIGPIPDAGVEGAPGVAPSPGARSAPVSGRRVALAAFVGTGLGVGVGVGFGLGACAGLGCWDGLASSLTEPEATGRARSETVPPSRADRGASTAGLASLTATKLAIASATKAGAMIRVRCLVAIGRARSVALRQPSCP